MLAIRDVNFSFFLWPGHSASLITSLELGIQFQLL